jgi:LysR family transcriptional regulator, regulator of abg operon
MHSKLSLNLNHLQHFLAIADQGSLRAAADSLGLSQPAVSKSLRALEAALGAPLIARNARGSTLTPYGDLLYARARLIGNEIERVTDEIQQLAGHREGRVTLGASAMPSLLLIPEAVARFRARQKDVRLDLIGGMPSVLLPRLMDGSLDFVVGPRPVQPISDHIDSIPLLQIASSIVVRRGHELEGARSIKAFVDAEWVLSSSAAHAESALHATIAKAGLPPAKIAARVESLWAAYSFIAKTRYVGLLPKHLSQENLLSDRLSYVAVPELSINDTYDVFLRRDAPLSSAAQNLVDDIKFQARRLRENADRANSKLRPDKRG